MKQGVSGRRPRGRSGGGGGGNNGGGGGGGGRRNAPLKTQNFDSNGPDVRVRGNATQVYEKYLALARDASAAGDRVVAESYFQHAEHYYRIINDNTDPQQGQARPDQSRPEPSRGEQSGRGQQARGEPDRGDGQDAREPANGRGQQGERRSGRNQRGDQQPGQDRDGAGRGVSDQPDDDAQTQERGTRQERRERYEQSERSDYGDQPQYEPKDTGGMNGHRQPRQDSATGHDGDADAFEGSGETHRRPDGYGRLSGASGDSQDTPESGDREAPQPAPKRAAPTRARRKPADESGEAPVRKRKPAAKKAKDGSGEGSGGSSGEAGSEAPGSDAGGEGQPDV